MKHKIIIPSRLLNDDRGVFGLSFSDFAAAIAVFMLSTKCLEGTGYELVAVPLAVLVLVVLSPIRLSTRRHILRDGARAIFTRRRLYDPRSSDPS